MKVAVVYNRESANVINLFGLSNREKIGLKTISRITAALKEEGHQVIALEGDKDLIDRLEEFMPRVIKGERPGLVFNVSYGIQGQARYTHVPSILEMVGIPYVASGPLAHSLALDKVVTKMILRQQGLPTPDFAVLQAPEFPLPDLPYPLVVKPKNEAVSFGLRVVHNPDELREASLVIFQEFRQPVLAEQFIEGREVNVGLLGNSPPEALPPVELIFGDGGPAVYTYEDKTGRSGRTISHLCPAPIGEQLIKKAQEIAIGAFQALGCYDCARVDMRLDKSGQLYILEVNSLPSLGEHGSYLIGAAHVGLDFKKLINRLVDVASARYFGAPRPPRLNNRSADPEQAVFSFITERRDRIETRLREWVGMASRSGDPLGLQHAIKRSREFFEEVNMKPVAEFTDNRHVCAWETLRKMDGGLLLIANLDTPIDVAFPMQPFRRDPEWLYGEGVGSSRGPLVMMEYALRALRSLRRLRRLPLGVLLYTDEGQDAVHSASLIRAAAQRAGEVLVLRPGVGGDKMITQRRGQRRYRFRVEGEPLRHGRYYRRPDTLRWSWSRLEEVAKLTSHQHRIAVSTIELRTERLPMRLPHRVIATLMLNYPSQEAADKTEEQIRTILGKGGPDWELELLSDRPPMPERGAGLRLYEEFAALASNWEIPLSRDSSAWSSVGGFVAPDKACLCGMGPVARELRTPQESILRLSLIQRTLLLAEFLVSRLGK